MKKVEYLVRVIRLPDDLTQALQNEDSELFSTAQIYQKLIDSGLLWKVWLIDEFHKTWLEVNFVNEEDEPEFHTIALDEGTYVKIEFEEYLVLG